MDHIPCNRIVVNQVTTEGMRQAFRQLELRDQARAVELLSQDPALTGAAAAKRAAGEQAMGSSSLGIADGDCAC